MYYVNKIVGWCLSPLGIGLCLVLLAFALSLWTDPCDKSKKGPARFPVRLRACPILLLAFVWLWVFSCGFFTRVIGLPLEGDEIDLAALPSADAIVLLGGGMNLHDRCGRPEICSGADRVWAAARLFRAGKAPLMTVSGKAAPAEIAFLADMGVETNRIVMLETARNTEEESHLIVRAIGKDRPKVLLVTSAWHMPRAKMLFERAGFEVVAAPTDYEAHACTEEKLAVADFFPSADGLNRNSYLAKEWVARVCYWVKGRF